MFAMGFFFFQILHEEWANYGVMFKYQPVDLIRYGAVTLNDVNTLYIYDKTDDSEVTVRQRNISVLNL